MRFAPTKITTRALRVAALTAAALAAPAHVGRAQTQRLAPAEYRARVEQSAASLESLAALEGEGVAAAAGEAWARGEVVEILPGLRQKTLREVRGLLPLTMNVARAEGGSVEVDNRWLHFQLGRYEGQPAGAEEVRAEVLDAAADRLRALAARLKESEDTSYVGRDKEAEKGRLAAILRGPDFAEKGARGGALERLFETVAKWIRDLFPAFQPPRPGASPGVSRAAQVVIYALAALVIALVAWRYWRWRRTRVKRPKERSEPRVVLGERLEPDQTAADILASAEELARRGNLRGAIRKAYIALLCELGDRRVIRLAQHKTNRDYLRSVRESAPSAYDLFRPLTLDFERHWYGLEDATEDDWKSFRSGCRNALEAN